MPLLLAVGSMFIRGWFRQCCCELLSRNAWLSSASLRSMEHRRSLANFGSPFLSVHVTERLTIGQFKYRN